MIKVIKAIFLFNNAKKQQHFDNLSAFIKFESQIESFNY